MMAIGTTPGRLTKVLLIESMSMTLVGIVAGIAVGCLITIYFQFHGIDFSGAEGSPDASGGSDAGGVGNPEVGMT